MKKVLIYMDGYQAKVWDVSTEELLHKAYVSLFNYLDYLDTYSCLMNDATVDQIHWYKQIKKGDYDNIDRFLTARKDYEYEEWFISSVED